MFANFKLVYKYIYIFAFFIVVSLQADYLKVEREAMRAYKNKDYKRAFLLYKEGALQNSLNSMLMIGLMLEKGLGTKQDKKKALKLYKLIIKKVTSAIREKKDLANSKKKLEFAIVAARRMGTMTGDERYNRVYRTLMEIRKKLSNGGKGGVSQTSKTTANKSKESLKQTIESYYKQCPSAKAVPLDYAKGITEIDCTLFQKFPEQMAKFMKLKTIREAALKNRNRALVKETDVEIKETIQPILEYLQKEAVECYKVSTYYLDTRACDYDYLVKTDPLFFSNVAYKMGEYVTKERYVDYELDVFEKEELINKLLSEFSNQTFRKKYDKE